MSDSSGSSWSENPNSPQVSHYMYSLEKANLVGILVGAVLYGMVVVLFFQCMFGLLNPANHTRGSLKWGLVAHTVVMFSLVTVSTTMGLDLQSVTYVDNREYNSEFGSGPLVYQFVTFSDPLNAVPNAMFTLSSWLADSLLLYRCYIIYAGNYWVVAIPSLMCLASLAMSIVFIYLTTRSDAITSQAAAIANFGVATFSVSLSLNVLLTVMIIVRLILHSRNLKNAMGATSRATRLYRAIVTMLIESCALYAITFLLFIATWRTGGPVLYIFDPILTETQVIAPFLITLRVANRTALTSDTVASGNIGSMRFGVQNKSAVGDETTRGEVPFSSATETNTTERSFGALSARDPDTVSATFDPSAGNLQQISHPDR